jgi:hypothetical protein
MEAVRRFFLIVGALFKGNFFISYKEETVKWNLIITFRPVSVGL